MMKKAISAFLLACSVQAGYAQASRDSVPGGTWVVESNINSPRDQIVKFYNSGLELIYEENVTGKKLRYEKARVREALDKTLKILMSTNEPVGSGVFAMMLKRKSHRNHRE